MVNYVYSKIRKPGMEKEEGDGWYLTFYERLQGYDLKHQLKAVSSALTKWLRIGGKFEEARKTFRDN